MKLDDFEIGKTFYAQAGHKWLCTDKGTRTITAIFLDYNKSEVWFKGPPYSLDEEVFDETDMDSCWTDLAEELVERSAPSVHPGFDFEDVKLQLNAINMQYQGFRKNLLKRNRLGPDGEIYHPYSGRRVNDTWYVLLFELFTRAYSEMPEDEFVALPLATEKDLINRNKKYPRPY